MANWVTLTWENDRLRLLEARVQGASIVFEHVAQFILPKNENSLPIKDQLRQFIQKHRLGKVEAIVLLNRSDVEVRPMLFPPVPVDELCDLVRFQAVKEFNAYDQNSPLDFFVTNKFANISRSALFPSVFSSSSRTNNPNRESTPHETTRTANHNNSPVHLLASTIRRELFQKISKFCEESGLNLRRILLRPCESAYLWKFSDEFNPTRTVLLLELDEEEIAQTVLHNGEPVFIRSPKIISPDDVSNPDFVAVLAVELRRTMIAVRNEIQGVTVDDIVVCGKDSRFADLARQISDTLGVPVKMFDAWSDPKSSGSKMLGVKSDLVKTSAKLQSELKTGKIHDPERYIALIGSIVRVGRNVSSDIDFCNPKRKQERIGYRIFANLAIAVVFLLILGWVGHGFYSQYSLNESNKALARKQNKLELTVKSVVPSRLQLQAIEGWHTDKIDWFGQIGWLCRNAPKSQDMMLTTLTLAATQGGSMSFTSLVRDSSIVSPMEEKFRSDNHDVRTGDKSEIYNNQRYRYQVMLWIYLSMSDANLIPVEFGEELITEPPTNDLPENNTAPADNNNSSEIENLIEADKKIE
ncbi:MAG: hypothetical protein LBJ00_01575 [Planctomycetaceae bacterium]|jgi:hypothetical protein|nr:hypothetical protein [Planctomycetaceae bacterium]